VPEGQFRGIRVDEFHDEVLGVEHRIAPLFLPSLTKQFQDNLAARGGPKSDDRRQIDFDGWLWHKSSQNVLVSVPRASSSVEKT